jgi:hypothetical protein
MSSTYKPALLKALVRVCGKSEALSIPLSALGREFATMYWNQTVVYHLRQAAVISKESEVVRRLRVIAERHGARSFADLSSRTQAEVEESMSAVLSIDVLRRFHNSKPADMAPLYEWSKGDLSISLSDQSHAFLRQNAATLEVVANYHWAEII